MKTKIRRSKVQESIIVTEYDDCITGERRRREFMVPANGGYIREWVRGDWKQVCDGLSDRGATLYLGAGGNLLAVIRREYRAMRRAEKSIFGE